MPSIIERGDGRYEIRESLYTPEGPRSRTLAIFRALSEEQLDHAQERATRPFDRDGVRARAQELGIPWVGVEISRDLRGVIAEVAAGAKPPPVIAAALRMAVEGHAAERLPDSVPGVMEWLGRSDAERGAALRDLLRLADRLPSGPRGRLCYPPISSAA